jgi:hypothetical protein
MSTLGLLWKYACRVPFSTTNLSWSLNNFLVSSVWPLGTTISISVVVLDEPSSAHPAPLTIAYVRSPRILPTAWAAASTASTSESGEDMVFPFSREFRKLPKEHCGLSSTSRNLFYSIK